MTAYLGLCQCQPCPGVLTDNAHATHQLPRVTVNVRVTRPGRSVCPSSVRGRSVLEAGNRGCVAVAWGFLFPSVKLIVSV